jgi:hypothetical protein
METWQEVRRLVLTGQVNRRVCGLRPGQGLGSSRIRWLTRSPVFLNPNIPLVQEIQLGHCRRQFKSVNARRRGLLLAGSRRDS